MIRDILGNRIKNIRFLEFHSKMEKFYIYNNKIYQIIRMYKHYKLDGGWYVEMFIRNVETNKRRTILMSLTKFKEKVLYNTYHKAKNMLRGEKTKDETK